MGTSPDTDPRHSIARLAQITGYDPRFLSEAARRRAFPSARRGRATVADPREVAAWLRAESERGIAESRARVDEIVARLLAAS